MTLPPFQTLLDDHGAEVYRFLLALIGPDDVDDCFQETFLAALRAYPTLRRGTSRRAWLLTIARHKAIDAARARARRAVPVGDPDERPAPPAVTTGLDGAAWDAVRALPERQRAAVFLRYAVDLSHREIARVMDSSEAAVRRNVHDGLKRLREVLA